MVDRVVSITAKNNQLSRHVRRLENCAEKDTTEPEKINNQTTLLSATENIEKINVVLKCLKEVLFVETLCV